MKVIATYTVLIAVLLLPLFIMAETIVVKTKAPHEFRMHPGSKSFGCITFSNNQWYDDWRNLVLQTSTQKISGTDIFAYGKVRVIE